MPTQSQAGSHAGTGRSLRARHDQVVAAEFAAQPITAGAAALTAGDLAGLPDPVRRYVKRSGALGRPRPQNMRVVLDANMYRRPGQAPMRARSVQYSFFARPARLFLMEARMFGLPVRALHVYRQERATFTVRVASSVNMVDLRGEQISAAETVTVLNDLCLMAPGALVDPRLAWTPVDDRSARVGFTNGPHTVSATLVVNDRDELVDFWSDDRPDSSTGTFIPMRWSTPVTQYRDSDGRHLIHRGAAVYDRPDGPFTYGEFTMRTITYDLAHPTTWSEESRKSFGWDTAQYAVPKRRISVMFSRDLRDGVARGDVTVSIRRPSRAQVKVGGRYPAAGIIIETDSFEVLPFSAVTEDDVVASGEIDREALRDLALTPGRSTTTPSSTESSSTWCEKRGVLETLYVGRLVGTGSCAVQSGRATSSARSTTGQGISRTGAARKPDGRCFVVGGPRTLIGALGEISVVTVTAGRVQARTWHGIHVRWARQREAVAERV